jgi:nicotinamidase-related amidase
MLFSAAGDWQNQHGIKPAQIDKKKIHLLLIDVQKDFCLPSGALYVGGRSGSGAIDDSRRTAEFIYRNLNAISHVTTTMDTHFAFQIFSPAFWVDHDGAPLQPHDTVAGDLTILRAGKTVGKATPSLLAASVIADGDLTELQKQAEFYVRELERGGKYQLIIWPEHCILGSDGHALIGVVHEARMFHSYVRGAQSDVETKGGNPLTECYSAFGAEVREYFDGRSLAQKNVDLVRKLLNDDRVVIGGQASSHCVKSSVDDLLSEILAKDPALTGKVYVLKDLMSSVTVPDGKGGFILDYTPEAEAALARFANAGMHIVKSTTPIEAWPGIDL